MRFCRRNAVALLVVLSMLRSAGSQVSCLLRSCSGCSVPCSGDLLPVPGVPGVPGAPGCSGHSGALLLQLRAPPRRSACSPALLRQRAAESCLLTASLPARSLAQGPKYQPIQDIVGKDNMPRGEKFGDKDPESIEEELVLAAKGGNVAQIEQLVAAGADVDWWDDVHGPGYTALMWATQTSQLGATKALLRLGADPNIAHKSGNIALQWAAREPSASRPPLAAACHLQPAHSAVLRRRGQGGDQPAADQRGQRSRERKLRRVHGAQLGRGDG